MTIWDSITGKKRAAQQQTTTTSSSFVDASPTSSSIDGGSFSVTPSPAVHDFLSDPSLLHPLSNIATDSLDYLKLEDSVISDLPGGKGALPTRGFTDDLCYGTGITYLSALGMGGALGLVEGIRRVPVTAPPKIKLNAILNGVTRRGPFLGNSAGVVAMLYNGINSYIGYLRGKHDPINSVLAGGISGALFKSTKGTKPMLISSGLVAGAAAVWTYGREAVL